MANAILNFHFDYLNPSLSCFDPALAHLFDIIGTRATLTCLRRKWARRTLYDAQKSIYFFSVLTENLHPPTLRYNKAEAVNSIIRHVAEILGIKTNEELEDLYRLVGSVTVYFACLTTEGKPRGTLRLGLISRELLMTTSNNQLQNQRKLWSS